MKRIMLLFGVFILNSLTACFAQTDYTHYLDKAVQQLEAGDCDAAQKFYDVYRELSGNNNLSIESNIKKCLQNKKDTAQQEIVVKDTVIRDTVIKEKVIYVDQHSQAEKPKKQKKDLKENPYCQSNKNRYIAWGVVGSGYPWNLVTSIELRGGRIVGIGGYVDLGLAFTPIHLSALYFGHDNNIYNGTGVSVDEGITVKTTFHYAAGLKFYFFKGLFVDVGYGSIAKSSMDVTYNDIYEDGHNYYDFDGQRRPWRSKEDVSSAIKKSVHNGHGILFHIGYNLVTEPASWASAGFFFGISGGASFDVINKVFAPSINLKIGMAWGL